MLDCNEHPIWKSRLRLPLRDDVEALERGHGTLMTPHPSFGHLTSHKNNPPECFCSAESKGRGSVTRLVGHAQLTPPRISSLTAFGNKFFSSPSERVDTVHFYTLNARTFCGCPMYRSRLCLPDYVRPYANPLVTYSPNVTTVHRALHPTFTIYYNILQ